MEDSETVLDPETLYLKQDCIGGGSFGRVYKGYDKRTGETVAIKVIDVENAEDEVEDIIQEIAILSELNSPYVTKYHGSFLKGSHLWIVMEFCSGGSCSDLMRPGAIPEEYISIIVRELLRGLDYLHADKKLHRDIKAANILLTQSGQVKLADFGVSGQLTATMTKKNTFVGTPFWMAPEVIKQSGYDYKADIWSLGITAMELALRDPPYSDIHPMKVLFLIPKNQPPQLDGPFSRAFKNFVDMCLRRDPKERPSARELLEHPFVRRAKKTIYLTELIERHERWLTARRERAAKEGVEPEDLAAVELEEDQNSREVPTPEEEDLWDFGTVRPAARAPELKPPKDAHSNARTREILEWEDDNERQMETKKVQFPSATAANLSPRKIPLPPSPVKNLPTEMPPNTPTRLEKTLPTPQNESPASCEYDKALQQSLVEDLGFLQLGNAVGSPSPSPAEKTRQGSVSTTTVQNSPLPNIRRGFIPGPLVNGSFPPATTSANVEVPDSRSARHSQATANNLTPDPVERRRQQQQPVRESVGQITQSNHQSTHDPNGGGNPPHVNGSTPSTDVTALNAVVLPALQDALRRHTTRMDLLERNPGANGQQVSQNEVDLHQRRRHAHNMIEGLVNEAATVFSKIEHWDNEAPIGMGSGVGSFLEGFLEEVLVRIEPADDDVNSARP